MPKAQKYWITQKPKVEGAEWGRKEVDGFVMPSGVFGIHKFMCDDGILFVVDHLPTGHRFTNGWTFGEALVMAERLEEHAELFNDGEFGQTAIDLWDEQTRARLMTILLNSTDPIGDL